MWIVPDKFAFAGTFEKEASVGTRACLDSIEFPLYCLSKTHFEVQNKIVFKKYETLPK